MYCPLRMIIEILIGFIVADRSVALISDLIGLSCLFGYARS
jgi:hypothetical protein